MYEIPYTMKYIILNSSKRTLYVSYHPIDTKIHSVQVKRVILPLFFGRSFSLTHKTSFVFGVEVVFALNFFDPSVFHRVLIYISIHVRRNTYKDSECV